MPNFILCWKNGNRQQVQGRDLKEACKLAKVPHHSLIALDLFEVDGKVTKVAGQAPCGCEYHAAQGESCRHDLQLVGL